MEIPLRHGEETLTIAMPATTMKPFPPKKPTPYQKPRSEPHHRRIDQRVEMIEKTIVVGLRCHGASRFHKPLCAPANGRRGRAKQLTPVECARGGPFARKLCVEPPHIDRPFQQRPEITAKFAATGMCAAAALRNIHHRDRRP